MHVQTNCVRRISNFTQSTMYVYECICHGCGTRLCWSCHALLFRVTPNPATVFKYKCSRLHQSPPHTLPHWTGYQYNTTQHDINLFGFPFAYICTVPTYVHGCAMHCHAHSVTNASTAGQHRTEVHRMELTLSECVHQHMPHAHLWSGWS